VFILYPLINPSSYNKKTKSEATGFIIAPKVFAVEIKNLWINEKAPGRPYSSKEMLNGTAAASINFLLFWKETWYALKAML
jgi:hypothetical protein